jgi:hypothetical protein
MKRRKPAKNATALANIDAKPLAEKTTGEGEGRPRAEMRLVMRAIREGWVIDPVVKQAIIGRASRILANPDAKPRDIARASATLIAIERLTLDAAKEEDRITRLDNGQLTETVGIMVVTGVPKPQ